jgi:hypothetical protein
LDFYFETAKMLVDCVIDDLVTLHASTFTTVRWGVGTGCVVCRIREVEINLTIQKFEKKKNLAPFLDPQFHIHSTTPRLI